MFQRRERVCCSVAGECSGDGVASKKSAGERAPYLASVVFFAFFTGGAGLSGAYGAAGRRERGDLSKPGGIERLFPGLNGKNL